MTRFLLSFLLCLVTFGLNAQENSFLNIGIGYPIIIGTNNIDYDYSINKGNSILFVEKEIKLLKKIPQLRLTPGLSSSVIKETFKSEGLGGGGKGNYKHRAMSTYLKFIYEINREPHVVSDYYFGIQVGYYINSKTTGSKSWWQVDYDSDHGHYSNHKEIDESGEDFFHSNYLGILAGIRPLGDTKSFIQPNIELAFYPSFATINSYYLNAEEKKSMLQISVSIGLGNKSGNISTE
ncbi:hypothetical protein [Draconibacterium halophilum]|uniref:Outer membrane protein beta-barrel domain-containing protein n=1 Tax=Draconibacterium halophilum TaxID=2706887 RepID=A0A6C0R9Z5_9BACT|nr:hypothetical protein [Draconibacterium halophilum]QIA07210.1 hypothetical protein G0Q07_05490 [Draconibacterium halophilum]